MSARDSKGLIFTPALIIMGRTARKNVCLSSRFKATEAAASKIISRTDFIPALPINSAYYDRERAQVKTFAKKLYRRVGLNMSLISLELEIGYLGHFLRYLGDI